MMFGLTVSDTQWSKRKVPFWVWSPLVATPSIFGLHHALRSFPRTKIATQVAITAWLFVSAQHYSHKALVYEKTSGQVAQDGQSCPSVSSNSLRT